MSKDDTKTPSQKLADEIEALQAMAPEKALEIIQTGKVLLALEARAEHIADHHVSLLRFTTHWKVAFGTPVIDFHHGHLEVSEMTPYPTLSLAAERAIHHHRRWDELPVETCETCTQGQIAGVMCETCGATQACSPRRRRGLCCGCSKALEDKVMGAQ